MMINITIDSPELEEFVQNEMNANRESFVNDFIEYVKQRKIKEDVRISIEQIERGEFMEIDEAFDRVIEAQ